jgi:hypothetical protein
LDFGKCFVVSFWSHSIKGIFSAFGKFIEDYPRNLTYKEKTKYGVVISSRKSMKKS